MAILHLQVNIVLIDGHGSHCTFAKSQQHRDSSIQPELDLFMSSGTWGMGCEGEAQMVSDIRNLTGALPRQLARDAFRRSGKQIRDSKQQEQREFEAHFSLSRA